jgi:hypothetical protein
LRDLERAGGEGCIGERYKIVAPVKAREPEKVLEYCERGLVVLVPLSLFERIVDELSGKLPRGCAIIVEVEGCWRGSEG